MKKFLKIITTALLALTIVLSAAACSFINTESTNSGNNSTGNGQTTPVPDNGITSGGSTNGYSSTNALEQASNSSAIKYRNVVFNAGESDYNSMPNDESARLNAIKKVQRSSIAISVSGGAGSGVLVDMNVLDDSNNVADAKEIVYILTCHHMISSTGNIVVYFPDKGCSYNNEDYIFEGVIGGKIADNVNKAVTLVGGDLYSDIALIKVDLSKPSSSGKTLNNEQIDDILSTKVKVAGDDYSPVKGEPVFSIGNPTGSLPGTVSCGTISYINRNGVSVSDIGNMCLMQIDVTSNPGNSGGGLYNLYGELIGVTNAGNTSYQNINFAIPSVLPSDDADANSDITNHGFKYCAEKLLSTASNTNYGCVPDSKMKFGFSVSEQPVASNSDSTQLCVVSVDEGSLAYLAGLKTGDVIKSVTKGETTTEISKTNEFSSIIKNLAIGESITIKISRTIKYPSYYNGVMTSDIDVKLTCYRFWFCYQAS